LQLGQKALDNIKDIIPEKLYSKYISNLKFDKELSDNINFYYKAPNIFISNWIKNKYLTNIKDYLQKHSNNEIKVNIYIKKENIENEIKKYSNNEQKKDDIYSSTILNPSYTFDSYVVGPSNEFAYSGAKNVSSNPGKLYNPLFFYGGVGLGKTHLLQAIGNENINKKILYLSTEHHQM
jgi:chromosomal replication initiator protein